MEPGDTQPTALYPAEIRAQAELVEALLNELSELVTRLGPLCLTRGSSDLEAYTAIVACIKHLEGKHHV
jgi:hypothetical protein